jgi:hypothetical protein
MIPFGWLSLHQALGRSREVRPQSVEWSGLGGAKDTFCVTVNDLHHKNYCYVSSCNDLYVTIDKNCNVT